eukprot:1995070-Pleurochrysis_carterae.AAC.1
MPGTLRTGSGAKKASTSPKLKPAQNWPFGLRWSAQILARRKLCPMPAEVVRPPVASCTRKRISETTPSASRRCEDAQKCMSETPELGRRANESEE